jgi:hypothetical protein
MKHNFCKRAVIRNTGYIMKDDAYRCVGSKRARHNTLRPKWHLNNGAVAPRVDYTINHKGQGIITITPMPNKFVGGNGSQAWSPQKPYSHTLNTHLRKRIKTLLHAIVKHGVEDPDSIDPYVEDVPAESELNWRGT